MSTQPTFNAKIMDLPIMKNLGENQIAKSVTNFRTGEKPLYNGLKLVTYGAVGYGVWTYVLPVAFVALGQMIALAITGGIALFLVLAAPAIFSWLRIAARALHKTAIKYKPFEQLEKERQKIIANQITFRVAKQNIQNLTQDMGLNADKCKEDVENGGREIIMLRGKVDQIKADMEDMIKTMGQAAKTEDRYVQLATKFNKNVGDLQRTINRVKQSEDFMMKYKTREQVMKKMSQKLTMVEGAMENKLADFDATVDFLKKDYDFASKSNAATYAAKSALGFASGWERDYSLEVIAESIASDTANTFGNLKDIESLTSNYNLDSDDLYNNLSLIADKMSFDTLDTDFKAYNNPDYVPTAKDMKNAGGWGDMFNS
jgi:hypothetical protein